MKQIRSFNVDLVWNVIDEVLKPSGKWNKTYYLVECENCGHQLFSQKAHLEKRKTCPGCSGKPAALKVDEKGNCISICEIGMIEAIRGIQEKHNLSERGAVKEFVETVKAHLPEDDPVRDSLTEGSVSSKYRRLTGKKPDKQKKRGEPPQKTYKVPADPGKVQHFLDKHLPGYKIVKMSGPEENQMSLPFADS